MSKFNFLPQSSSVETLLKASEAALQYLPEPEKAELEKALRTFETFGAPVLWSPGDVDADGQLGLTEGEKLETIGRFIGDYECKDSDWDAIGKAAHDVLSERRIHIRVEFDTRYTGGDYSGVGEFVYIPLELIEALAKQDPNGDDGVELAFTKHTKLDSMHIINYTLDEHYNQDGELVLDAPLQVEN